MNNTENIKLQDVFSRSNTAFVRAIATIVIIFCHLSGFLEKSPFDPVFVFVPNGYLAVACFFFFSGYNLFINFICKEQGWSKNFWKKKFFRLYLPFVVANFLFQIYYRMVNSEPETVWEVILSILGVHIKNTTLWYIQSIIVLYALCYLFFAAYSVVKRIIGKRIYLSISTLIIMALYYYQSSRCSVFPHYTVTIPLPFYVGAWIAIWGDLIMEQWQRHRGIVIAITAFLFIQSITYRTDDALSIHVHGEIELYTLLATAVLPVLIMSAFIGNKIDVPIMNFISKYSLEMYMLHALCFGIFSEIINVTNDFLFLLVYLVSLMVLSIAVNRFASFCKTKYELHFGKL